MKSLKRVLLTVAVAVSACFGASAQYYQLANQATDMLSTILRGGANYRGTVDVGYLNGIGNKQANFLEISTTQGFKYSKLFFMGVGAGVDFMFTEVHEGYYVPSGANYKKNGVMIPLFTDFKLNLGDESNVNFFIDLKVGAGFYVSNKYILVGDGYINSGESFLLRPSIGFRVPLSASNPKYALNVGASYQLLTNSYWYNPNANRSVTLNSLGVTLGFEW